MNKERFDIHQHITDKIVSAIERSAGDFRLPWHRAFRKPSVSSPRCGTLNRPMPSTRFCRRAF
jgi:antirestriction protein ArdC